MRGIILAAGRGRRMGDLTEDLPKCMVKLHGQRLIDWQVKALASAGIGPIAIVRGYRPEAFDLAVHYFDNPRWSDTNMVASLACAADWLYREPCLVSYSDIVYSPASVKALMGATEGISVAYDPNWLSLWTARFADPLSDAETFRLDAGGALVEIGTRATSVNDIQGQYMGLVKFTPEGWRAAHAFWQALDRSARDPLDMTSLLRRLIAQGQRIQAIPIAEPWYEVDSESDLRHYQNLQTLFPESGSS